MSIIIEPSRLFKETCPDFIGAAMVASVVNSTTSPELWTMLGEQADALKQAYDINSIKLQSGIAATRAAYKAAGKDPSRYRPACEQLVRRVLQGKTLNSVGTLVDIGNLVSICFGYSTAVIDADNLASENIILDFGHRDEAYVGIGRGALNIEHLPAYRDAVGAFATPTSDSERTMASMETHRLLFIVNGYDGRREVVENAVEYTRRLLEQFAAASVYDVIWY